MIGWQCLIGDQEKILCHNTNTMFGEKELFKDVSKVNLVTLLPKYNFPPGFDHAVIDENKQILNFCSSRYSLVKNSDIFKPIEEQFTELGIDFIRVIKIINKSKFYVDYIIKDRKDIDTITGIFPKISVWNSYDGGSMLRHEVGFHRLAGTNTIASPTHIKKDIYRHASGCDSNTTEEQVLQIVNDSKDFITNSLRDVKALKALTKIAVTKKKVGAVGRAIGLSKKTIECAEERFLQEVSHGMKYNNEFGEEVTHQGCGRNMYAVYVSLNYGIYNTNLKELPEKKIEKDRKLLLAIIR